MDSLTRDKTKYEVGQVWRIHPACAMYEYSWMTDSRTRHPLLNGGHKIIKALWYRNPPAISHSWAEVVTEDGEIIDVELYELNKCVQL